VASTNLDGIGSDRHAAPGLDFGLNRAGRRAEARRLRKTGATLAAIPAALGTTALLLGATALPAGAATLTVTSLDDGDSDGTCDTDCTLRDALDDAVDGDLIVFQTGLTGDYDITSTLVIDDAVTIQGPGAGVVAIDGAGSFRIFELTADGTDTITISGLTLKNGNTADKGGAIYNDNDGVLTVDSVVFTDNTAFGGGAIYADQTSLTVVNSTFTGNTTGGGPGGAIYINPTGPVTISGSTFTNNFADAGGGAIAQWYGDGTLTVTDSTFTGNTTGGGDGGAIYVYESGDVTITGSTFTDNTAADDGGAIQVHDIGAFTITGSTFSGNTSVDGGGVIYASSIDAFTITGSTFTDNTSEGKGGAIDAYDIGAFTITGSTIADNTAASSGGGISVGSEGSSDLIIRNSTISGNTAGTSGGGIYFRSSQYQANGLVIENSTISGNTAGEAGGGIYMSALNDLEITMSTITNNTALRGAGIYMRPETVITGGPRASDAPVQTVIGSIISGNTTTDVEGTATVGVQSSIVGTTGTGITVTDNGGNVTGAPLLGPLQDNGGPTLTHALLVGSPAIDAGPDPVPTFPGSTDDQRGTGFVRTVNGRADIGAYEVQPAIPTFTG